MLFLQYLQTNPSYYVAVVIAVVVSVSMHELAHGLVAVRLGDRTPIDQERITLNPLVHMGPLSLVVLLFTGIAWGAMPIDRSRLRGRFGEALVAAAGPFTNLLIAAFALTSLGLWQRYRHAVSDDPGNMARNGELLLWVFGSVNIGLALFNMIPCPPLDGSHILANFSRPFARTLDAMMESGMYFRMAFILFAIGGSFVLPFATKLAIGYLRWVRGDTPWLGNQ